MVSVLLDVKFVMSKGCSPNCFESIDQTVGEKVGVALMTVKVFVTGIGEL